MSDCSSNTLRQLEQSEPTAETLSSSPPDSKENNSANLIGMMPDSTISTGVNANNIITLMQSSPPPHSYRHSRAYRHFKNPPQPHMCIRTTTEAGEELFINVLSWTRIVIPQEPSDPIPLYGGMRVPPGSPRSPPIVFAVMANPEVLKDSGRHSKDPEERRAMVELMCDFVEAMNPGVKLVRNAVILKDRDISGELKDVWNAVQAQRDREREEQMLQQRQQQHYHNLTTQQMFPKAGENNVNTTASSGPMDQQMEEQYQHSQQREEYIDNNAMIKLTTENESPMPIISKSDTQNVDHNVDDSRATAATNESTYSNNIESTNADLITSDALITESNKLTTASENKEISNNTCHFNGNSDAGDQTDAINKADNHIDEKTGDNNKPTMSPSGNNNFNKNNTPTTPATSPIAPSSQHDTITNTPTIAPAATNISNNISTTSSTPPIETNITPKVTPPTPITSPPTKKDKLGGFLPNGCIFPRFKHGKNKDKDKEKEKEKDKDKDKESKSKDKDKTLLNALKKSKEKKVAPSEQLEKTTSTTTNTSDAVGSKSQYERNFINLESEVQRLDLNKIDATTGNENNMFIKLKLSTSSATAK